MTDDEKEPTTRVAMLWPVELKDAVREEVGPRGLTDFTLEAVRAKLGVHDAHKEDSKELNEVRFLAQRLADAIALGGDYEDRAETLRLMELPAWIRTDGWASDLAAIVQPEDSTPEPVVEPDLPSLADIDEMNEPEVMETKPCPYWHQDQQCELPSRHEGAHHAGELTWGEPAPDLPAVGDPGTIVSEPPSAPKGDLAERVRQKALEKGVDLSGIDLKPASKVETPPVRGAHAQLEEHNHAFEVVEGGRRCACGTMIDDTTKPPTLTEVEPEVAPSNPNACPNCGGELVSGECWECM